MGVDIGDQVQFWRKDAQPVSWRVGGIFKTNINHMDRQMAFVRFEDLKEQCNEIAIMLAPGTNVSTATEASLSRLPTGSVVRTWQDSLTELVQLISLNRVAMNVVLTLALLILAFGVSNTVYISVSERTREFGILKAIGVTPIGIEIIVLAEVLLLVSLAGITGLALGAGVSAMWAQWGLDLSRWTSANPHFIASGVIYPRLVLRSLLLPMTVAVACGLLAGSFPARRAGRIRVVQALRTI